MVAFREVRPPGVYHVGSQSRVTPLSIADTHIAGFVGIANKGPLDTPKLLAEAAKAVAFAKQPPAMVEPEQQKPLL